MTDEEIHAALVRWRPTMREYLRYSAVSSGFLSRVASEGLRAALYDRALPRRSSKVMLMGTMLGALISGDAEGLGRVAMCPPSAVNYQGGPLTRQCKEWRQLEEHKIREGCDGMLTTAEYQGIMLGFAAIVGENDACGASVAGLLDSLGRREREIIEAPSGSRLVVRGLRKSPSMPEVSHRWSPIDPENGEPLPECKIRIDWVAHPEPGAWAALSLKCTGIPLLKMWPREWRYRYRFSEAFYRQGIRDLFGGAEVPHYLILQRFEAPYETAIEKLNPMTAPPGHYPTAAVLDDVWRRECLPALRTVRDYRERGWGPEEEGFKS